MKKVLLTINNNRLSGIEKFTLLLAKYLDKTKYEVEVGIPTYGPICELLKEYNIDYFIFNNKLNERHTLSGVLYLFKQIRRKKYDIIHAQAGIAPCLLGKLLGTEFIIEHKHGLDFTSDQIENMSFLKLNYERVKKYFVNKTLTGCKADKSVLLKRFNYKSENVYIVYNGLENDTEVIEKRINVKFTIGTIGRLTFQKGQEYLIESAKILISSGYELEFHIYGEGEKYVEYVDLINKYGLGNSVFLKGYTKNISETMKTFDLFVLPSRYEGIPYVILEAMKAKIPVIASDVGGVKEVINNIVNGILVRKENSIELSEKIIQLYESEKIRNELIKNAEKDFYDKYTIEKTIKTIELLYSSIILKNKK